MAVPGSVFLLCQELGEVCELHINGLFNPLTGDWHSAVFAECFARNLWARWVLPALVFCAISEQQDPLYRRNIEASRCDLFRS